MDQLSKIKFLEGYEEGFITDCITVGNRIYGKDPRGQAGKSKRFKVVFCEL